MSDFEKNDFEMKVRASLNADVENLDNVMRGQLAAARRKALNQPAKNSWLKKWLCKDYCLPAGSLALCSLLAAFILVSPRPDSSHENVANIQAQAESTDQLTAFELLTDADDGDETADPDFYLWADEILATESQPNAA